MRKCIVYAVCLCGLPTLADTTNLFDPSGASADECANIIAGFVPHDGGSWAKPFAAISNYVVEARGVLDVGVDARRTYAELVEKIVDCEPPEELSQKASYYSDKYWFLEKTVKLVFDGDELMVANNRRILELCARFVGHMRVQHEIYKHYSYCIESGVVIGVPNGERDAMSNATLLNNQKAGVECMLRRCLAFNGRGFSEYRFYGCDIYDRCISAGLSPEFVDRLAVLAKVPSGTFRPDPPPKPDIPKQEEPKVQTNAVSAVVAPVAEDSPLDDPHPAYYDDIDEMWEGEDNGGDSYLYRISEKGRR